MLGWRFALAYCNEPLWSQLPFCDHQVFLNVLHQPSEKLGHARLGFLVKRSRFGYVDFL